MPPDSQALEKAAFARCNSENIASPGAVQGFGALLGVTKDSFVIEYASENLSTLFGLGSTSPLGMTLDALMDRESRHAFKNLIASAPLVQARLNVGHLKVNGRKTHVAVSNSHQHWVVELEPQDGPARNFADHAAATTLLMNQVQTAECAQGLMDRLVQLLSLISGYDRVMAYRFDAEWNGEVIAEKTSIGVEPLLGLRFPHWDIPEQARDFMATVPMRFVADAARDPVAIDRLSERCAPLDTSQAHLRGVSPRHAEYLLNLGVGASFSHYITIGDRVWGMIAFHHRKPRVPSLTLRETCATLAPLLNTKMQALELAETLHLQHEIDSMRARIADHATPENVLSLELQAAIEAVHKTFDIDGVMIGVGDDHTHVGTCVPLDVADQFRERAREADEGVWFSSRLHSDLPKVSDRLDGVCGALCLDRSDRRWVCLLRRAASKEIAWAGPPRKDLDLSDGSPRMHPRKLFERYIDTVSTRSVPWSKNDIALLKGISLSLIAANERKTVLTAMRRRQELVVDELNHRVRNILSLVQSISRQARRHNASLDSYSNALEQRIKALSIAHHLGSGQESTPVSLQKILRMEAVPYDPAGKGIVTVAGPDFGLTAEAAPIFALVIHELITNAAKHGALSTPQGHVDVLLAETDGQAILNWVEMGGPSVTPPTTRGFGTTLIEQAIPYELHGHSTMEFNPGGLNARITLPASILVDTPRLDATKAQANTVAAKPVPVDMPRTGTILVVEDNYMIAVDTLASLKSLGFDDVELAPNHAHANTILRSKKISLAILDINLGHGGTSIELARALDQRGIPFFFVTGYGELAPLPTGLTQRMKLQKPVALPELEAAIFTLLELKKAG